MQVHSTGLEPVKVFSRIDLDSTWLQTSNYIQRGFLVLTAIVVLMQIAFQEISELDFYGIYFYAIFALIFLVLFFFPVVESATVKIPQKGYQRYVIIAVLFILFTLVKIYFNSWVPHREDELYQLVGVRDFNPITTAFKQQHPPLSYIFSAAGERLFGTSMLGLRFFNHIISSFLFVQFFLVLKVFKLSTIRAIVSTFLFFLTPFVFNYSIESRPYGLGLLLGCFFIVEFFLNLLFFKNLSLTVARIAAAATLLLMAIGFQAPIFICTAASYLILMLFASKVDRSKLLAIFGGLVLSLLLLIPIQKRIVEFSGQYIKSSENLSTQIYESILRIINLRIFYGFTTLQIGIIAITVFIFLIGYLLFKRFKLVPKKMEPTQPISQYLILALTFFLASIIMLFVSIGAFVQFVNWDFKERYVLLGTLLLCLSAIFALNFFTDHVKKRFSKLINDQYADQIYVFLVLGIITFYVLNPHWVFQRRFERSSIEIVLKQIQPNDIFLPICKPPAGCWDYNLDLDFYSRSHQLKVPENMLNPYYYFLKNWRQIKDQDSLFVHLKYPSGISLPEDLQSKKVLHSHYETYLIKLEGPEKTEQLKRLLDLMKKSIPSGRMEEYAAAYDFETIINPAASVHKQGPATKINAWQ